MHRTEYAQFKVLIKRPGSSHLGDLLYDSSLCKGEEGFIWQLAPSSARYAPLFWGSFPVSIDMGPKETDGTLPKVYLMEDEIAWARDFLRAYPNPISVGINCKPMWAHLREVPISNWIPIMQKLQEKFTLLQFGLSTQFTPLPGAISFLDLPIRQVAACYHVIGRHVGVDTGNVHLMLSVGGKVFVATPPDCDHHRHEIWHYKHPNATYRNFAQMGELLPEILKTL